MVNSLLRPGPGVLFHFEGDNALGVFKRAIQIYHERADGLAIIVADEAGRAIDFYLTPDDVSRLKQALSMRAGPDTAPNDKTQDAGRRDKDRAVGHLLDIWEQYPNDERQTLSETLRNALDGLMRVCERPA